METLLAWRRKKVWTSTVSIDKRNINSFLHLFSLLKACFQRRPYSWQKSWVDIWQKKQKNQCCTCVYGLMVILQSQLQDCNPIWSWILSNQFPAGHGAILRSGIGSWIGAINYTQESLVHTCANCFPFLINLTFLSLSWSFKAHGTHGHRTKSASGGLNIGNYKQKRAKRK